MIPQYQIDLEKKVTQIHEDQGFSGQVAHVEMIRHLPGARHEDPRRFRVTFFEEDGTHHQYLIGHEIY